MSKIPQEQVPGVSHRRAHSRSMGADAVMMTELPPLDSAVLPPGIRAYGA